MSRTDYIIAGSSVLSPAEWTPKDIDGCVLWFRSDLGVTKDGDNLVSAWADQSGAGNHAIQDGANKPLWVAEQLNGHPEIRFTSASKEFLDLTSLISVAAFTMFFATQLKAACSPLGSYDVAVDGFYRYSSSAIRVAVDGSQGTFSSISSMTPYNTYCLYRESDDQFSLTQNGQSKGTIPIHTGTFEQNAIGRREDFYHGGGTVEIVFYANYIGEENIELVENYLNGRYAIY